MAYLLHTKQQTVTLSILRLDFVFHCGTGLHTNVCGSCVFAARTADFSSAVGRGVYSLDAPGQTTVAPR